MNKDEIELVLARLETMPDHLQVHLGKTGTVEKAQLIEHVRKQDALGKVFVEMQLAYIREMAKGI
jgi:hypothetical protein